MYLINKFSESKKDYKFCIDYISNEKIEGWAFCNSDELDFIILRKANKEIASGKIEILREDVSNIYKCSGRTGFKIILPNKKFHFEEEVTIWAKTKKQNLLQITNFGNKNKYLMRINKIISKPHKAIFKRYLDTSIEISKEYLENLEKF